MDQLNTAVRNFDNTMSGWLNVVDRNEYVSAAITLFLILYAGLAAPRLPEYFARLFEHPLFQLLVFFLIVYSAQRSPTIAIIAAIGLMVSLNTLTRYKVNNQLLSMLQKQENMNASPNESVPQHMEMEEDDRLMEQSMSEDMLSELQEVDDKCTKKLDYRNNFYPQYVNMKPDTYRAKAEGGDVGGYDPTAVYTSI